MEQLISDMALARLVIYVLLGVTGFLGTGVLFFLNGIYGKFVQLVDDIEEIKLDVALLKAGATPPVPNGGDHVEKQPRRRH